MEQDDKKDKQQEATHCADAHIPSETAVFDGAHLNEMNMNPSQKEYMQEVHRISAYAGFFINSKPQGLGPMPMLIDCFIHKFVLLAQITVMSKYMEDKFGIPPDEYLGKVSSTIRELLGVAQVSQHILITPEGVFVEKGDPA